MKLKINIALGIIGGLVFQQADAQQAATDPDFRLRTSPNENGKMLEFHTGEHLDEDSSIQLMSDMVEVEAGAEYRLSIHFRTTEGPTDEDLPADVKLRFFTDDAEEEWRSGEYEAKISEESKNYPGDTGEWQHLELTSEAPDDATYADVIFDSYGVTEHGPATINVDAVYLAEPQYFTSVDEDMKAGRAYEYKLEQNYPNPFNPVTTVSYQIGEASDVTIEVYNVLGQQVQTLVSGEEHQPGRYEVQFNGEELSNGMYMYRLEAGDFTETRKMMLVK